jgi:phosphate-selective porin OprO and OprP
MILPFVLTLFSQLEPQNDAGTFEPPVIAQQTVTVPQTSAPSTGTAIVSAKFGQGVTVSQGDFSLNLRGRVQVQALAVFAGSAPESVRLNDISVRRARIGIKLGLPYKLALNLQLAFAPRDMELDAPNVLRDFNIEWRPLRDVSVRIGQGKVPFDVQRMVSSSSLQMVDRSIVTGELNLDRDVGVTLFSDDLFGLNERLRYAVGIFSGDGRNRFGTDNGLLYAGRLRFSLFGPFDDKVEGDVERKSDLRVAFGGALGHNVSTIRPRSTTGLPYTAARFDYTQATADLHVKWSGLSLLSQVFWRQADKNSDSNLVKGVELTEFSRSALGYFVQMGGYANRYLEFTARYGDIQPFVDTDPTFKRQREVGGGVNIMFVKHDLKLQGDYFYLDDGAGQNSRHQIRVQMQVYF